MSWFPKSLVNSLLPQSQEEQEEEEPEQGHGRGVKDDLTELTNTISRQLWGVASFLAPPTHEKENPSPVSEELTDNSPKLVGIRSDLAEIGGRFKMGLSLLSTHKAVNEISRLASGFLLDEGDKEEILDDGYVGVTEKVLEFANNISMHPDTWLEFPLLVIDENFDNFEMSDAQQEHASAIELLAPALADLKVALCPSHMREMCFWKIYFILLHPRLNKIDSDLLSTPQIMDARTMMLQELQVQEAAQSRNSMAVLSSKEVIDEGPSIQEVKDVMTAPSNKMGNNGSSVEEENSQFQEKEVLTDTVTVSTTNLAQIHTKENADQGEDRGIGTSLNVKKQLGNEEDVSFSDLEDDENDESSGKMSLRSTQNSRVSPSKKQAGQPRSREKNSEGEESGGDWIDVDDFDFDSAVSL